MAIGKKVILLQKDFSKELHAVAQTILKTLFFSKHNPRNQKIMRKIWHLTRSNGWWSMMGGWMKLNLTQLQQQQVIKTTPYIIAYRFKSLFLSHKFWLGFINMPFSDGHFHSTPRMELGNESGVNTFFKVAGVEWWG